MPAIASTWHAIITPFHLMSFFQSFFRCQQAARQSNGSSSGGLSAISTQRKRLLSSREGADLAERGVLSVWAPLLLLLSIT